jgi:PAS domain S-box-containing protein
MAAERPREARRGGDGLESLLSGAGAAATWRWEIAEGRLYADDRFADFYGLEPEALAAGAPTAVFYSAIHAEDRLRVRMGVAAMLAGAEVFSKDYRLHSPGEDVRWVHAEGRTRYDAEDRPVRFEGALVDVTEHRRLAERLRVAQAAGGVGAFEYVEGRASFSVSSQFCQLLGLHVSAVLPVRTVNALVQDGDTLIGPGEAGAAPTEVRIRRPSDGQIRWIARRSERVTDPDVETRQIGAIYDVTSLKSAEARLRSLNDELEQRVAERTRERDRTWKLAPVLMVVVDSSGVLQSLNPACTAVLGYTEAEAVGRRFSDFVTPEDVGAVAAALAELVDGAIKAELDFSVVVRSGERRRTTWTGVEENGLIYAYGRDITDQLEIEEQLRQAQKMEAVGQLTGGIAHDFNNLLTGIVGSLDLLQSRLGRGRTENLERYIQAAQTSANRAAALTHRLLAFSRRQPLQPKPVNANGLISGMEELLRRTLSERVRLEVIAAGGLWPTLCDPNQLENAILNLAINARDAMGEGGRLTVETCNTHLDRAYAAQNVGVEPGQYICICVTDTGSGMTPEVIRRAFDPFFTTKPSGQGTGLGLSMIYGFAKQSNGHVAIYSEPGRGTTVKLYLPRHRGPAVQRGPDAPIFGPHQAEAGETVLVVEDEAIVRDLIVEVLQDLGYHALEAEDGAAGLAILQSEARIDLVVTDVGLPDITGREMIERARPHRSDLRVLFITGYAENAVFGNGHLDSGQQMITKPFPVDALAARIREMIEQPRP